MKTKILLLSALSGFISILTSCYREIDVEKYRTTPKIVINCPFLNALPFPRKLSQHPTP